MDRRPDVYTRKLRLELAFALLGLCDLSLQARNVLFAPTLERALLMQMADPHRCAELARGLKQLGTFRQPPALFKKEAR